MEPPNRAGIGAVVYINGRVVYAHESSIHSFWTDESNGPSVVLTKPVPKGKDRLAASANRLFVRHEKDVAIVDLGTWARHREFPGNYFDHSLRGDTWVGLRDEGGAVAVEFRDENGDERSRSVLTASPSAYLGLVQDEGAVIVAFASSGVYKISGAGQVRLQSEGTLLGLALGEPGFVLLESTSSGTIARVFDGEGSVRRTVAIPIRSPLPSPVVMGSRMVVGAQDGSFATVDLEEGAVVRQGQVPGAQHLESIVGIETPDGRFLLSVSVSGSRKTVHLLEPESSTGRAQQIAQFVAATEVSLLVADGRPVIVASASYQNRIEIYEAFA